MTRWRRIGAAAVLGCAALLALGLAAAQPVALAAHCHPKLCRPRPTTPPQPSFDQTTDPNPGHSSASAPAAAVASEVSDPPSAPDPTIPGTPGPAVGTLVTPHGVLALPATTPPITPHPAGGDSTLIVVLLLGLGVVAVGAITISVALPR